MLVVLLFAFLGLLFALSFLLIRRITVYTDAPLRSVIVLGVTALNVPLARLFSLLIIRHLLFSMTNIASLSIMMMLSLVVRSLTNLNIRLFILIPLVHHRETEQ